MRIKEYTGILTNLYQFYHQEHLSTLILVNRDICLDL